MSQYSVDWIPGARRRLASLWNENPLVRQEISDASQEIDAALESDPWAVGRGFSPQHRVIVRIPLSVLYRIIDDDRRVEVLAVKFWDDLAAGRRMNYLAHGWRFAHEPYVLAGTAVPDWLNVIDRRMKVRSKTAALFVEHEDSATAAVARGIVQHHRDDAWFHDSPAFVQLSGEFSRQLAAVLPGDEGFRPWFLGHILVELLLDAALIEEDPRRLDDYYTALAALDPAATQSAVNAIATKTTDRLEALLPRFLAERFLYDYLDDGKLLSRLNAVMRRVGLPQLPEEITPLFDEMRSQVRKARHELLTHPTET